MFFLKTRLNFFFFNASTSTGKDAKGISLLHSNDEGLNCQNPWNGGRTWQNVVIDFKLSFMSSDPGINFIFRHLSFKSHQNVSFYLKIYYDVIFNKKLETVCILQRTEVLTCYMAHLSMDLILP